MRPALTRGERLRKVESASGYSRRILQRRLTWWSNPFRPYDPRYHHWRFHRLKEILFHRHQGDPEERWRCCANWQRTLINKWNSREFVKRFSVPLPELYWSGRWARNLPIDQLPESFVIRPLLEANMRGVHVVAGNVKLIGNGPPQRDFLIRQLIAERGYFGISPLLCEEAVLNENDELSLPLELKCHMFAGFVGAIELVRRNPDDIDLYRFYEPDWTPWKILPYVDTKEMPVQDPPPYLDNLLESARKLGRAVETYMRVDYLLTDDRYLFNEFSSCPGVKDNTPELDEYFDSLWQTHVPDQS
jgi:hypothetical protein